MLKLIKTPLSWLRKLSIKKKIFLTIVVLIALGIGISSQNKDKQQYQLAKAEYTSITEIVSETGNVTTAGVTPLYSTTTGIIEEVLVDNGDLVEKDQVLFKVKATATKQQQEASLATYLTAKNALETAEATQLSLQAQMFNEWDQFKELAEGDDYENEDGTPKYDQRNLPEFHIPEKEWLAAEANYKKQQQVISQARVNSSAAWRAYQSTQDSEVIALFDGQIRNLSVTQGDTVTVPTSPTLSSVTPALLLVDESVDTTIKIEIGEIDILKLEAGQPAIVELDALPHTNLEATVARVDTVAIPSDSVVNYSVYVQLNSPNDSVRAGMTADVDITVASKESVLTVPSSAVKPYEGGRAVRVLDSQDEIEFVPVETGLRGDGLIEIISGIEADTEVIVALTNDQVERGGGLF